MCRAQAHTDTSASHLLFTCFVLYVHILDHLPAETCAVIRPRLQIALRLPGVEPGAQAWEDCMLPLHYRHSCSRDLYGSACLIFFLQALRANPLVSLWGLASYQLHFTFVSHCQVTSNPGLCFISICQLGSIPRTALGSFYREMLQEASGTTSFKRACLDACFASPRLFFAMFRSSPPAMPC